MKSLLTFLLWLKLNWIAPSLMPNLKWLGIMFYRMDRNSHGGGVIMYINTELTSRQRPDLEFQEIESISVELCLDKTK